jgi:acyl-CoA synthetase (AMP-forming)/AMP-acid ligase II
MALSAWKRLAQESRAALVRAETLARVSLQKKLHANLRPAGAWFLARELPKGRQTPSFLFRFHAENAPHRIALTYHDRHYSFFEVNELMDRIGVALAARGLGRGDRALLILKNRPELIFLQGGIGRIGASAVAVSWRSTPAELAYLATHSGAKVVFFDAEVTETVRALREKLPALGSEAFVAVRGAPDGFVTYEMLLSGVRGAPEDRSDEGAVVTYTSGTTGKPKGAVRKFPKDAVTATFAFLGESPIGPDDVHLAVCPLYHATAFGFVAFSYVMGGRVVLLDDFRPELFLEAVARHHVTTTAVVPTMLYRLAELGKDRLREVDTSSLRAIFSGGAPLSGSLANSVMELFGPTLYNFYGATETGIVTLAGPDDLRQSPGTIGRVIPTCDVRLYRDDGTLCAEGEVGELYAKSPLLVEGYHDDAEATRASMRDGYFSVGDLARRDARGCYFIEGRKRDLIITGGVNVYPAEVEAVLDAHPAVVEAAVIGVPDAEWGERVRAFVVPRAGVRLELAELAAHCKSRLASAKVPRDYVLLEALPKNPTGKVLKRELRERG